MLNLKNIPLGIISLSLLFSSVIILISVNKYESFQYTQIREEENESLLSGVRLSKIKLKVKETPKPKVFEPAKVKSPGKSETMNEEKGKKLFEQVIYDKTQAEKTLQDKVIWERNLADFIGYISGGIEKNGFNSLVANLSDEEWDTLFKYLKTR